jgi:bacterioferritin (cytochrome b1)
MSVITRKIGNGEYAYLVRREGDRVIHTYLGSVRKPEVIAKLRQSREASMIPDRFRALFWDVDIERIQIKKHARYIIERILEYGDLDSIYWLQRVFSGQTILDVLSESRKISQKSRNLWEAWFGEGREHA